MKNVDEIRSRIQLLLEQELERRVKESSRRIPRLCVHYYKHFLDTQREISGEPNPFYNRIVRDHDELAHGMLDLCLYGSENPGEWSGDMCETEKDAEACPHFEPILSKEKIELDFETILVDKKRLEEELPNVFELAWVIDFVEAPVKMSWWAQLCRVFRRRPSVVTSDLLNLLPPKKP